VTGDSKGAGPIGPHFTAGSLLTNNKLIKSRLQDPERWLDVYLLSTCANIDGFVDVWCRLSFVNEVGYKHTE
jgi:hypothetical protein